MSDELHLDNALSQQLVARLQEKKLTQEGWSKQQCKACRNGKVIWNGQQHPCPSCKGTGWKWRPGMIERSGR